MEGTRGGVPTDIQDSERLPGRDDITCDERRPNGFQSRHETAGVLDGEDRSIHHGATEGDHTVRGGGHLCSHHGGQIDAAMAGTVLVRGSAKRSCDSARPGHRPAPARPFGCRGGFRRRHGSRGGESEQQSDDEKGESSGDCAHEASLVGVHSVAGAGIVGHRGTPEQDRRAA